MYLPYRRPGVHGKLTNCADKDSVTFDEDRTKLV